MGSLSKKTPLVSMPKRDNSYIIMRFSNQFAVGDVTATVRVDRMRQCLWDMTASDAWECLVCSFVIARTIA